MGINMLKILKLKIAARRIQKTDKKKSVKKTKSKTIKSKNTKHSSAKASNKLERTMLYILNAIKRNAKRFWNWVRYIDLIGLVNLTLLITIIVLCSVLIINIINYRNVSASKFVQERDITLTRKAFGTDDNFRTFPKIKPETTVVQKTITQNIVLDKNGNTVKINSRRYVRVLQGDIVIDGNFPSEKLSNNMKITGNLYLQNMRKYTLPEKIYIDGDLFLRDVSMLQFAGDFVVTGNIYVSHRSSFGPLPRTAKLGGQVIF